jgi:hypothetical protein
VSLPSFSEVDQYLDEKVKGKLRHFERSDAKEFDAVFPVVDNVVVVGESLYRLAYDTLVSITIQTDGNGIHKLTHVGCCLF